MFDFSPIQLIIVLVIAVLVLGPSRLPEFSRTVGKGIRDFKATLTGEDVEPTPPPAPASPITTATAGEPTSPARSDDVLEGIVVSGDTPPADAPPSSSTR